MMNIEMALLCVREHFLKHVGNVKEYIKFTIIPFILNKYQNSVWVFRTTHGSENKKTFKHETYPNAWQL